MDEGQHEPATPSRSVDAAAIRWGETHPEEDVEHVAPPNLPQAEGTVPNRHSASAEAAALRWQELAENEPPV